MVEVGGYRKGIGQGSDRARPDEVAESFALPLQSGVCTIYLTAHLLRRLRRSGFAVMNRPRAPETAAFPGCGGPD